MHRSNFRKREFTNHLIILAAPNPRVSSKSSFMYFCFTSCRSSVLLYISGRYASPGPSLCSSQSARNFWWKRFQVSVIVFKIQTLYDWQQIKSQVPKTLYVSVFLTSQILKKETNVKSPIHNHIMSSPDKKSNTKTNKMRNASLNFKQEAMDNRRERTIKVV